MTAVCRSITKLAAGLYLLAIIWIFGCAEVQPPSGGEPDKRSPRVDSTLPANSAVNVAPGNTIEIYFSERIKSGTGRQVFISPRPSKDPKLKWRSDRLSITFDEPFAPGQTTVVTLGSAVTDLRNNRLDSSMTFAFSTGPTLDSGNVSGTVLSAGNPQSGLLVGLWDISRIADSIPLDSLYPDYLTSTDVKGNFKLKFLPEKEYRLIAFADRNRDDRINTRKEAMALPDRPINLGGELPLDSLVMTVATADTSALGIVSVSSSPSRMIRVRFSGEVRLEYLKNHLLDASLTSVKDTSLEYSPIGLLESDQTEASSIVLAFEKLSPGPYSLLLPLKADSSLRYDSLTIRDQSDAELPVIVRHTPGEQPIFATDVNIALAFSEPLDTSKVGKETFELIKSDSLPVLSRTIWNDGLHVTILPDTILPGTSYQLNVTEFEIFDLAGNALGDSLTSFRFRTLNADSLGEISGTVNVRLRDKSLDPTVLILREVTNKFIDTLTVKDKSFSLSVPAGKYLLSGFIDSNRDGARTDGSLRPFRLAETSTIYHDTIAVRARFETTGIDVVFK